MPITYGALKKIVAPFAGRTGKAATDCSVDTFARTVMEYLLYSGSTAGLRKVDVLAVRGRITLPPEVETPVKVRIGGRVSTIWSKWVSFHSTYESFDKCLNASEVLEEEGDFTPLQYPIPSGGAEIAILANCDENEKARLIVAGEDVSGREIYTTFEGAPVVGEMFRLIKGNARFGQVAFKRITGIIKPKTNGYVTVFAADKTTGRLTQFLGDYSPSEERPLYRSWRLGAKNCHSDLIKLAILCRVRLKDNYLDQELTLFDNTLAIQMAAQRIQSELNNDIQTAAYKDGATVKLLEGEAGYKRAPNAAIDVFRPLSGGAIKNVVR